MKKRTIFGVVLLLLASTVLPLKAQTIGENVFSVTDNQIGLSLRGGHLELRGPAVIERNRQFGVRLNGSSGSFGRFSDVEDRVAVRNNGTAGDTRTAGIFLTGSHLDLFLADVTNNLGRGVLLQDNSSLRLFQTTVSNNGADGLRLEALSTARLLDFTLLENNTGFDLSCAPNSHAAGNASGVRRMFCPGFDQSPTPGLPEPGKPE